MDSAYIFKQAGNLAFSGKIAGYDPGGNQSHGFAILEIENGICTNLTIETLTTADDVIAELDKLGNDLKGIGIDTLAAWSAGISGWRSADIWLRESYPDVRNSIVSPNGLYGSMALNGMMVLHEIRKSNPLIQVTETHPKVLYWALTQNRYSYSEQCKLMDEFLGKTLNCTIETKDDHQWDAAISAVAALRGISGEWSHDLFHEKNSDVGRLIFPVGETKYWWPK